MPSSSPPALETRDLVRTAGVLASFGPLSCSVQRGERVAVASRDGRDAAVMMGLLAGVLRPDAGRIRFMGVDVTRREHAARARAGLVLCSRDGPGPGPHSVTSHVALAAGARQGRSARLTGGLLADPEIADAVDVALRAVGLGGQAGMPVSALGPLDRRRLQLAAALALDPLLILLDMPLAGLAPPQIAVFADLVNGVQARTGCALLASVVWDAGDPLSAEREIRLQDGRVAVPRARASTASDGAPTSLGAEQVGHA